MTITDTQVFYTESALRRLRELDHANPPHLQTDEQKRQLTLTAETIVRLEGRDEVRVADLEDAEEVILGTHGLYYCPQCRNVYLYGVVGRILLCPHHGEERHLIKWRPM